MRLFISNNNNLCYSFEELQWDTYLINSDYSRRVYRFTCHNYDIKKEL